MKTEPNARKMLRNAYATKHLSTQDKSDANDPASTDGLVQEAAETRVYRTVQLVQLIQ